MHRVGTHQRPSIDNYRNRIKPFSLAEARAKRRGEHALVEALMYAASLDTEMAVRSCLAALRYTYGISRYLMVRDQVDDLLDTIDPSRRVLSRLSSATNSANLEIPQFRYPQPQPLSIHKGETA